MYGMILIYSFYFRSWRPFWSAILDFKTYILTVLCVKYIMYHIRPKKSDNASKWVISDDR